MSKLKIRKSKLATRDSNQRIKTRRKVAHDVMNLQNIKTKVGKEQDLLYNYSLHTEEFPRGVKTQEDKKKFRSSVRRTLKSYFRVIKKATGKEKTLLINQAKQWAMQIFTRGHIPQF